MKFLVVLICILISACNRQASVPYVEPQLYSDVEEFIEDSQKYYEKEIERIETVLEEPIKEPYEAPVLTARFTADDCIFGGLDNDEGYKVVSVDKERNQYLLQCLTESDCKGGLSTNWISSFDKYMLKVDCRKISR